MYNDKAQKKEEHADLFILTYKQYVITMKRIIYKTPREGGIKRRVGRFVSSSECKHFTEQRSVATSRTTRSRVHGSISERLGDIMLKKVNIM